MENAILRILREGFLDAGATLSPATDLFETGLDSMAVMQLQLAIEDEFGVTIEPVDLSRDNFRTATDIAALIRSKQ
jgi:acyl carrier protein